MYALGLSQYNDYKINKSRPAMLYFDGIDDIVEIPDHPDLNTGPSYPAGTIELKFIASNIMNRSIIYEEGGANNGINIYLDDGSLYTGWWANGAIFKYFNTSENYFLSPYMIIRKIEKGQEYHVVLRWDVTLNRVDALLNGIQFGTSSLDTPLSTHTDDIGIGAVDTETRYHDGGTSVTYFNGKIREIRKWNIYRNDTEIINNMYIPLSGNDAGLVGYWKMNEGRGNIVRDFSINENHGIINGATWTY